MPDSLIAEAASGAAFVLLHKLLFRDRSDLQCEGIRRDLFGPGQFSPREDIKTFIRVRVHDFLYLEASRSEVTTLRSAV